MNKESQREKLERQKVYLEDLISYNQKFFNPNDITALELINYLQQIQQAYLHLRNKEAKKIDKLIDGHTHITSFNGSTLFGKPGFGNVLHLDIWSQNVYNYFMLYSKYSLSEFKRIYGSEAYHQLVSSINKINRFLHQNRINLPTRVLSPSALPVIIIPNDNSTIVAESLNDIAIRYENYFKLILPQRDEKLLKENVCLANQLLSTISIEDNRLPEKLINGINRTRLLQKQ